MGEHILKMSGCSIVQQEALAGDIAILPKEAFVGSVDFFWSGRRDLGRAGRKKRQME